MLWSYGGILWHDDDLIYSNIHIYYTCMLSLQSISVAHHFNQIFKSQTNSSSIKSTHQCIVNIELN